ncbi:hypothetical protein [Branchiibius hedensis]|uniref:hypothetical protein n=1 Tax=Branchiibius hedensis TaxID=672460 RepID=UPI0011B20E17|nr:hypothetical protein [Branchiibius hedensis]
MPGRRLAAEVASALPWCASEPLGRLAPALTRFAAAQIPWSGADVVTALRSAAIRRGHDFEALATIEIRTRPAILLAGLLRDLDPDADHPAHEPATTGDPWVTDPVLVDGDLDEYGEALHPARCHGSRCDGRGWIVEDLLQAGEDRRCPNCPPQIRGWRPHSPSAAADGEPLF